MKVRYSRATLLSSPGTGLETMSALSRLWALRLLVPLGAHRQLLFADGFQNDLLGRALGVEADDGEALEVRGLPERLAELRRLHRTAERKRNTCKLPPQLQSNLERLTTALPLSPLEQHLLAFAVVLASDTLLEAVASGLGYISTSAAYQALAVLLDSDLGSVRSALSANGALASSGLIKFDRSGQGELSSKLMLLSGELADQLLHVDAEPMDLLRETVLIAAPGELRREDFDHVASMLDVLVPYLDQALGHGHTGVNVLLHGVPGTGKTQLARVLAEQLGARLFEVTSEDGDGDPITGDRRLQAYRAAQCFMARQRAMVLFDEAEDVFTPAEGMFGRRRPASSKAWMNRMLEENTVPAIWITNDVSSMDAAVVRRFDVVLEMPVPPRQQRERILSHACGDIALARDLRALGALDRLAPAVAVRAAKVVRAVNDKLVSTSQHKALQGLIHETLRAQGHEVPWVKPSARPNIAFDTAFVNADLDLSRLVDGLQRSRMGRMCLYGPPGTGKSAFARWAAERLDIPLIALGCSDLLSPWVGQSERNIALAFRKAQSEGGLLLIDEVDALLRDRSRAGHTWEHSLAAELLTQLEAFDGLSIMTTNLLDSLDPAALRRFDIKIKFDYLKPAQSTALLEHCCAALGLDAPQQWLANKVARVGMLAPGDFAAVLRRHAIQPFERPEDLVFALEGDKSLREANRPSVAWLN
ncbi:AAA family ATPase [Roseateles sp. BYS87W]|uniref:AAA family ATPase n=1 Tax=Pelomonas baiyunensis TaxID=3299026 RepID=A0ABW7H3A8_9BURK